MINRAGPWGTGPYKLVEGAISPLKGLDRAVLEANQDYWNQSQMPQVRRIVIDNTLSLKDAVEIVKTSEGRVDLVPSLSPLDTLRVAGSSFAKVVKGRGALATVFGIFNMRKADSPWHDIRLRQAVNYAINRADLIRYATKGNGEIIPALIPPSGFGYDPNLAPYPFAPTKAQQLLREAGYPNGLALTLIAPKPLEIQATVVSKMLEQVDIKVERQMLSRDVRRQKTLLPRLDQPAEQQPWDIALKRFWDRANFPPLRLYHRYVIDGLEDWVTEQPTIRQLYNQILNTVDQEHQQTLIHQMERHTRDQAYFLFLYNPISLYAVNEAVQFVPYANGLLHLAAMSVTDQHWSVRKQKAAVQAQTDNPARQVDPDNTDQVTLGQRVYASFCAGCHGARLEGQVDWQKRLPLGNFPAPPHDETGHTWHHADQWLFEIVKHGGRYYAPSRHRSAMPAYDEMLSDDEIWAVISFIKHHWPASIREQQEQKNVHHR